MKVKDSYRLALIVLAGIAVRLFTLWIGRAEFTGWFNHTYYYFVQVRGLLEQGSLPYADMPLLFHLYALVTRLFVAAGIEREVAIVASTRLLMCVVPALIALPVYGIVREVNGTEPIRGNQWVLVAVAAFLPLSISHLPEFMQKNMLGMFFLTALILFSRRLLRGATMRDAAFAGILVILIVLTHYGTSAAMALYCVASLIAYALVSRDRPKVALFAGLLALGSVLLAGAIYLLDAQRFHRILVFLADSIDNSLVAALISGSRERMDVLLSLVAIATIYVLLCAVYFWTYARCRSHLRDADRVFWLANIFFFGLLILPLVDERLMGRLALFAVIPLLVTLVYVEKYAGWRSWLRTACVTLAAVGVVLMGVGELVSSRIRNSNHEEVLADIRALGALVPLGPNDLVITKTGAEHICNWFYRVKAGVIPSLSLDDFENYETIYVLNPIEGELNFEGIENRTAERESDRYLFMLRNIPRPADVGALFFTENIELFELDAPPTEWIFTDGGRWNGYARLGSPGSSAAPLAAERANSPTSP